MQNVAAGTINVGTVSTSANRIAISNEGDGTVNADSASVTNGNGTAVWQYGGTVNVRSISVSGGKGVLMAGPGLTNAGTISAVSGVSTEINDSDGKVNTDTGTATLTLNKGTGASCVLDSITVAKIGATTIGALPTVSKNGVAGAWYTDENLTSLFTGTTVSGANALYSTFYVKPTVTTAWDGVTKDTTWYTGHESDTSFAINTGARLAGLASLVNAGTDTFQNKNITLGGNIDLVGYAWTPIGTADHPFNGTFNGGTNSITGLAIGTSASPNTAHTYAGLFGCTGATSSIHDVSLVGVKIYASPTSSTATPAMVGGLVGNNGGAVTDCSIDGTVTTTGEAAYVGGIAGGSSGTFSGCTSAATVTGGDSVGAAGGIVGYTSKSITDCSSSGTVSVGAPKGDAPMAGGIVGNLKSTGAVKVSNCHAAGAVMGADYAQLGGIAGNCEREITNSYATGNVSGGTVSILGGLVGVGACPITNSYATGSVRGGRGSGAGGLAGSSSFPISKCWASGDVSVNGSGSIGSNDGNAAGGLVGISHSSAISYCYATGDASGTSFAGGLIGENKFISSPYLTLTDCYAAGRASGTEYGCGCGLVSNGASATMTNCYWNSTLNTAAYGTGRVARDTSEPTGKATSQMQTADFAQLLTDGSSGKCSWTYVSGVNNGYPLISGVGYAVLSGLAVNNGTLTPAFSSGTTDYSVSVNSGVNSIAVTPTTGATSASITVNGISVASAGPSDAITLSANGTTDIPVVVSDGLFQITYTIHVTKAPAYGISLGQSGTKVFSTQTAGYNAVTPSSVTVSNTGSQPTGDLTVALSGANAGSFSLSANSVSSIAASGTGSFTIGPKTGLSAGSYTAMVTVSGSNITAKTFDVNFTVTAAPTYGIGLGQTGTHTFSPQTAGYNAVTPLSVTVSNTGNQPTGDLTVVLSGANAGSFLLSGNSVSSIAAGGTGSFTIGPKTGLSLGRYTATVTVSGSSITTKTFDVSFAVNSNSGGTSTGGGSSSGGGTVTPPKTSSDSTSGEVKVTIQGSASTAKVTGDSMNKAIDAAFEQAKRNSSHAKVTLSVDAPKDAKKVTAGIPTESFKKLGDSKTDTSLTVTSPIGSITFDNSAIETIGSIAKGSDINITAAKVEKSSLTPEQQALVGARPVLDLSIESNGKAISNFGGTATVSIPYTPAQGEDTSNLVVWYLADDGSLIAMPCTYADGKLTFTTTHFSKYVLASVPFKDITANDWFYKAAVYAHGKGLMNGTSTDKFDPSAKTTRSMIVSMLYRNAAQPNVSATANFADVNTSAYYANAVKWANEKGIVKGSSDGKFEPDNFVTREQLVSILYRNAGSPAVGNVDMTKFLDAGKLSAYATPALAWAIQNGVIKGSVDGSLNPDGNAGRAEVATMLMNYFNVVK